jgi:hypothetical protein
MCSVVKEGNVASVNVEQAGKRKKNCYEMSYQEVILEGKNETKIILNLPVWTYGIELWGCDSISNIEIIQRYQSKILRILTNAPWYVTNNTLHTDLHIPYVREVFQERIAIHRTAIASHPNPLMVPLLHLPTTRRLKRRWTLDGTH